MIVKCIFKKGENYGGREYSYLCPQHLDDTIKEGDLVEIEKLQANGEPLPQVVKVAKTHIPEDEVGFPIDKLRTIKRLYVDPKEPEHHED